jgi:hypothetical protein
VSTLTSEQLADLDFLRRKAAEGDVEAHAGFLTAVDEHAAELLRLARVGLAVESRTQHQGAGPGPR